METERAIAERWADNPAAGLTDGAWLQGLVRAHLVETEVGMAAIKQYMMRFGDPGTRESHVQRYRSLLCSIAPGLGWLVAFRMLQAIGGSMLNPVAMSIIVNTFTDRAERARAIGLWGGTFGVSLALGPVVGGALIASVGWRGIFWVNIPVGVAAASRIGPLSVLPQTDAENVAASPKACVHPLASKTQ